MMQRISPKLEHAIDARNHLGETPIWSQAEGALYWTNVEEPHEIQRWDARTGEIKRWPMPERVGGFVMKKSGGAVVALASGLFDLDFKTGALSLRVASTLPSHLALHETGCDPSGRLWVGSLNHNMSLHNLNPGGGVMHRLEGDKLIPVFEGFSVANGLAFSPDGRRLYFSDSPTARCDVWDLDPATGALSNQRTFFELAPGDGFVDGSTVDSEGGYWATMVSVGKLRRYTPDGKLDLIVDLPFENPTKVAFGGEGLETLFVTSTADSFSGAPISELNGGVFTFKPGVKGYPEPMIAA
jgi:sugar lactone lactonase YvrE